MQSLSAKRSWHAPFAACDAQQVKLKESYFMTRSSFQVAFEGVSFDSGEIDVRDLAPSLLALGDVIQAANKALNGKRADARLMVRAAEKGSFIANLTVDVSFMSAVGDLLDAIHESPDRVAAAKELIALLIGGGTVAGGAAVGLIQVLRFLKGTKPDKLEQNKDGTTTIINNGTMVLADSRVVKLLGDITTRSAVDEFASKALSPKGVERIRFNSVDQHDTPPLVLTEDDRVSLRLPPPEDVAVVKETKERVALLRIWVVPLQGDYVWRFSDGGEKPFTANIEDIDFTNQVVDAKISFARGDVLRCLIREVQTLSEAGLQREITVLKVLEHIPAARQPRLI